MKTTKLIRSITVAGVFAAALSLSACDMNISFGSPEQDQTETHGQGADAAQPEEAQAQAEEPVAEEPEANEPIAEESPNTSSSDNASDGTSSGYGTSDSGSEGSSSASGENAGGSDPGFAIDEDGNGVIPSALLEDDIKVAYSKQGVTVDSVECLNDLRITMRKGSAACNVTAYAKKRYGTVKVTSVSGSNVGYSLDFPSFS